MKVQYVVLALLFVGCDRSDRLQSNTHMMPDASDSATVLQLEPQRTFVVREVLRLKNPGDGTPFTRIVDMFATPSGEVLVLDGGNYNVQVIGTDGKVLVEWGRRGQGPGELTRPVAITTVGDTVFVLDRYLHAFSLRGELYYSMNPHPPSNRTPAVAELVADNGQLTVVERSSDGELESDDSLKEWWTFQRRSTETGLFSDTLLKLPALVTYRRGDVFYRELFGSVPAFAIASSGEVIYTDGRTYTLQVLDADGTLLRSIVADVPPIEVTRSDVDSTIEEMLSRGAPHGSSRLGPTRRILQSIPQAASRPVLGRLLAGQGEFMVERLDQAAATQSHWDLVSTQGLYIGTVLLPASYTPIALGPRAIYGVARSSMDEHILVVYGIQRE